MWNIGAGGGQADPESGVATSAHPLLDCLVVRSSRAEGWMAHGGGKENKRIHELGHVLARIAAASSLAAPAPSTR